MPSKICNTCKIDKDISEFSPNYKGKFKVSQKCRECTKLWARDFRKKNPHQLKAWKYKTSPEEIKEVEERMMCEICGVILTKKTLRIDHDHSTGKIRGLLCDSCNLGLGKFLDKQELLLSAIQYLKKEYA